MTRHDFRTHRVFTPIRLLVTSIVLLIALARTPQTVFAATPSVTSLSTNGAQIGRYQKFEATFQISKTFPTTSFLPYYYYDATDTPASDPGRTSPYGVDGISIDAHFTAPSGAALVAPAFYYQDYIRGGTSTETMTPTTNYMWKVRFAPEELGTYTYYLTVQDKEGTTRYPASGTLAFTAIASASKGFVRVAPTDSRFMAFSNGQSFIPLAGARQWWQCCGKRTFDYENLFDDYGRNGINLTRVWDQDDGWALTVEGHFDTYAYPDDFNPVDRGVNIGAMPKGTQMNQRGNYEEDKIIEAAERNGVYIELCSHSDPYWIWDASVHNEPWNPSPTTFDDPQHLNYWKRNFRYRVARWGYSTAVLAWEVWNEHGHIPPGTNVYNFYQTYGQYQKATDPYRHLRTTSQGSQAYSPAFWSSSAMDIANYHDYMMSSRYPAALVNDEANFVQKFAWCLGTNGTYCSGLGLGDGTTWSGANKPWIWGEIDVGTTVWNEVHPNAAKGEGRLRMLHNTTWAGLFTPIGTSPIDWYWDQEDQATITARYADRKITRNFFANVDYAGARFVYLMTSADAPTGYSGETVTASNAKARVYAMRRNDKTAAYLWVHHRDYTWANFASTPAAISSNVTIGNLLNGVTYTVSIWNTHTGALISSTPMTPAGGAITFAVNNLTNDVAVKVESSTGGTPTPTRTATPTRTSTPRPSSSWIFLPLSVR
ncbi:MAG: DUF5060 domain-containing protein [Chloroflexi bacterium]|nr:DUF5060 domain-containing protein [Chloroflexota bacterium]